MGDATPTPRPWTEARGKIVAQPDPPNGPHETICKMETGTADSALIVRAVNSFDALVASLEGLAKDADRIGGDGYGMPECPWCGAQGFDPGNRHDSDCELLKARAALALAGRGT